MRTTTDNYLRDVLYELRERARAALEEYRAKGKLDDRLAAQFESGRAMAYHEVLSFMLLQLDAFQMSRADYDIPADFNPDALLRP